MLSSVILYAEYDTDFNSIFQLNHSWRSYEIGKEISKQGFFQTSNRIKYVYVEYGSDCTRNNTDLFGAKRN